MTTRIKHVALCSYHPQSLRKFYETLFGMRGPESTGRDSVVLTDGYVGMNINLMKNGYLAGFNHFGLEVDDVAAVQDRVRELYPSVSWLKRPSTRPFAGISMHDPLGNTFDLSQRGMENRALVYADDVAEAQHPRHITHFTLRVVDPALIAAFHRDVFGLQEWEKAPDDPNYYLTDGKVTLIVQPWKIGDYAGMGLSRPAPDHLGFRVESLEEFRADLERMVASDPTLAPHPFKGQEGELRRQLLATCRFGHYQLADPDTVLLDVSEG